MNIYLNGIYSVALSVYCVDGVLILDDKRSVKARSKRE